MECLTRFGFRLPRDVERDLADSLSKEEDRKKVIDYGDFIEAVKTEQDNGDHQERTKVIGTRDTDLLVDKIRKRMEETLGSETNSTKRAKEVFSEIDRDDSGAIDKTELSQAMRILRIEVMENELDSLFKRFAKEDRSGYPVIEYEGFLQLLGFKRQTLSSSQVDKAEVDALIATIRRRIEETVGVDGASSAAKVKDVFSDIDRDNSGTIDKRELEQALRVLKVNTSARDVDMLFDRFDDSRRGQLDYHNYLELLGYQRSADIARRLSPRGGPGVLSPRSKDRLDILVTRLQRKLEDTLGSEAQSSSRVKEAFSEIDRDGSGTIDRVELGQALRFLKLDVNEKDADDLFRRFEKERTGTIDYNGFLQLLGFDSKLASRRAEKNSDDEELDSLIKRIRSKLEDNLGSEAQSTKRVKEVSFSIMGEDWLILYVFLHVPNRNPLLTITLPSMKSLSLVIIGLR